MAGGIFKKLFGGEQSADLDSCCGAVTVTAEDETTVEDKAQEQVEASSPEPLTTADR